MLAQYTAAALVAVIMIEGIRRFGRIEPGAAMGVTFTAMFAAGVLPYYLHQLDPVQGAAHFAVPDTEAKTLVNQLRALVPGYLCPTLVREEQGHESKTPV